MEALVLLFLLFIGIFIVVYVIRLPIIIAENRKLSDADVNVIALLSWFGVFLGITWIVALIFALFWDPQSQPGTSDLDRMNALEKLADLKSKGIITPQEFNKQKKKILGK